MDSEHCSIKRKMRCDVCNINLIGEESWQSHCAGKRHKHAVYLSQKNSALERTVYIKGVYPWVNPQDFAQFLESKAGKVINCNIFPGYALVEFENRSSAEEILKTRVYYCGQKLLIKPKRRREIKNVEPEKGIEYDQVQEILERALGNTINNDFENQLNILLEQVVRKDPQHENKINELCRILEELFHPIFRDCKATAFGSAVTGLSFVGSDIDIVLWASGSDKTLHTAEDLVKVGKRLMFSHLNQFSKIVSIPKAKTPIIKFVHIPTRIQCDVSFHNTLSVQNSRVLAFIISSDARIRKMMLFIKFWAQMHGIATRIRLNNYTIVLLAIFYLQQGEDPLLPAIRDLRDPQASVPVNSWDTNFQVKSNYKFTSNNKESTENLVAGFFRFYAELNWANTVVSPLLGLLIPRENFLPENLDNLPVGQEIYKTVTSAGAKPLVITTPLCVQDPFELNHNVAHNVCGKVSYFQDLCNTVVALLLHGPDGVQLPPLTKLLNKDLCPDVSKRKSNSQDNVTLIMKAKEYLKKEYLGPCNIDDDPFPRLANIVFNCIKVILQDIFKLKVTRDKPAGVKVQKTDTSDNVHSEQNVLICHGTHGVYHNRKKFRKMVQGQQNWFQQLSQVSETMIAMNEATSIDLEFQCILKADQKNDNLIVKLENLNQSGDFDTATTFISQVLLTWIDRALKCGLALKYFSACREIKIVNRELSQPDANVVDME